MTLNRNFLDGKKLARFGNEHSIEVLRVGYLGPKRYPLAPSMIFHLGDADLVHCHSSDSFLDYLALAKSVHGKPLVLSTHGGFFHSGFLASVKKRWFRTVTRVGLRAFDAVVASSKSDYDLFSTICPAEKLHLIPNGVHVTRLMNDRRLCEPKGVLYLGRIQRNKGLENLIRAHAKVCMRGIGQSLTIAGADWDGLLPDLKKLASSLQVTPFVIFSGEVSDAEKADLLLSAKVFASASTYEGFGISAIEAMAAGTPTILNDIPPFREISGVPPVAMITDFRDPERASVDLGAMLSMAPNAWEEASAASRARALAFSWPNKAPQFTAVYHQVLSR